MVLNVTFGGDIVTLAAKGVSKFITQAQKDAAYALRTTVTQTAVEGRRVMTEELKSKLDRPVPFIFKSYFYRPAKDLENPVAQVLVRGDKVDNYIESITQTGKHVPTRLTQRFTKHIPLLRPGESLVPTKRVKRNSKGNVPASAVSRLISSNAAGTQATKRAIVIKKGRYRGIYQIQRRKFTKIWTPARVNSYRPRIDLEKVLARVTKDFDRRYNENLQKNINKSLQKAGLR